jgi:soluble lytic murein transglycosylase-like protein
MRRLAALVLALFSQLAIAGNQLYEPLSASVQSQMQSTVSDQATPFLAFDTVEDARVWLDAMSKKLERRMPDKRTRDELLVTVHYEATRAGLDPQLVLGLIQVESNFQKYALSRAGARGPHASDAILGRSSSGQPGQNLFHLRTNLRYGCVILKHYLDIEKGDLFRALGRYNGSLGYAEYPNTVVRAWVDNWKYPIRLASAAP